MQDVAFQLERLVAGMYIYYRQCHRALKPAAVFPIEVELGINLEDAIKRYADTEEPVQSQDNSDVTAPELNVADDGKGQSPNGQSSNGLGQSSNSQQFVEDLLLDLGLASSDAVPPIQTGQ